MADADTYNFILRNLPESAVKGKKILEIGITGPFQFAPKPELVQRGAIEYVGMNIVKMRDVDVICDVSLGIPQPYTQDYFDIVIAQEVLEHVEHWQEFLVAAAQSLKTDGLFIFTTRSQGYPYHEAPGDFWRFDASVIQKAFSYQWDVHVERDTLEPGIMVVLKKLYKYATVTPGVMALPITEAKTKLLTGTIAYLPRAHKELMELTLRSTKSSGQFGRLGKDIAYHAQDVNPVGGVCEAVHSCLWAKEIIEYHNGSLMGNWGELIREAFERGDYDWVLFVSNDVIWHDDAAEQMEKYLKVADPMVYAVAEPTAVFLLSRELWEKMKPNWFEDYLPASWEDMDLACQVWAAGGEVDMHKFDSWLNHEVRGTIRNLGVDYRNGTNMTNWEKNKDIYYRRWQHGWEGWDFKPPPKEWLEEVRKNPKRP